jgi:FdhD protein
MDTRIEIMRWEGDAARACTDSVALEEPLEILLNGESLAVTMRTPGDDFALTAGFLFAESLIRSAWDIQAMGYCGVPDDPDAQNLLHVALKAEGNPAFARARLQRNFLATSSCGVCGKASLAAAQCLAPPLPDSDFCVPVAALRAQNAQMRAAQSTFDRTGGLHAAGLFTEEGALLSLREDVGRHNAVDKLIGTEVLAGRMPLNDRILMVSGRSSFEIMQKAAMARIPVVCAVSAPSSLAVRLARDLNMTLIGFLRGDTMNIYAGAERVRS